MTYALYYYDSCPFCQMVLRILPTINVEVDKRNVLRHPEFHREKMQSTGRSQVPCLRIQGEDGSDTWLFESADIINYLRSL